VARLLTTLDERGKTVKVLHGTAAALSLPFSPKNKD